ncbi:tyrosine-type recombinase/integrase [Duganella vulcania]|uniref:Tyrosine-type recombinase/integrase n=1 Tax=Duganella vulcania TaxID=2692166 RepID=A0A845GN24_9BURK|nr:tyrosine-type recombinase/integrase [Duganella vulcania]MYM94127.1 tyrosine-type recombinase/integrase [Duganella vulcania]
MQRWLDHAVTPPQLLPDTVDGTLAYLTQVLGHACYEAWTLLRVKQIYPSLGDAKAAKPALFQLLLAHQQVIEWWQGGRLRCAPADQAPKQQDVLKQLLASHRRRFQTVDGDLPPAAEVDGVLGWITLVDGRTPVSLHAWLCGSIGRFQNHDVATNTLAAVDDASALVLFLQERASRSRHTLRAYANDLRKLIEWCRDRQYGPLSDLTRTDLLAYKHQLSEHRVSTDDDGSQQIKGAGESTLARAMAVVASLYQYWYDTGYLIANPAAGLLSGTQVRTGFVPTRFLPPAALAVCDLMMARAVAQTDNLTQRRRQAIWALFRYGGVRLAELAWDSRTNLPRIESDDEGRWALYVMGKGDKQRVVPLPDVAIGPIKAYRVARGLSSSLSRFEVIPLIHGFKGGSLMESGLYAEVKAIFVEAGGALAIDSPVRAVLLASASPHWLRHAYARALVVDHKVPLTVAQSLLGHASIQTTAGYAKTDLSQLREFVDLSFKAGHS